jgi:hypothetical protein
MENRSNKKPAAQFCGRVSSELFSLYKTPRFTGPVKRRETCAALGGPVNAQLRSGDNDGTQLEFVRATGFPTYNGGPVGTVIGVVFFGSIVTA